MSLQLYASDLTDAEWDVIRPLLPTPARTGRPRRHSWRTILNAIFYQLRTGGAWRFQVQPRRWVVERCFAWLPRHRRLARDYERMVQTSEMLVEIAMIRPLLRRLA